MSRVGMRSASLFLCFALSASVDPTSAAPKRVAPPLPAAAENSIAGVKIGMDKDDVHALLTAQGASDGGRSAAQDKQDKDVGGKKGKPGDPDDALPESWTLKGTPYEKVAFAADSEDKVLWVTAFARPGQGVPFAKIGSLARAAASGPAFAVWNIISPHGSYRVIARGRDGKAMTVSLLPLKSVNPNGAFSPQIIPNAAAKKSTGTESPR